jgi:hypothetical protein
MAEKKANTNTKKATTKKAAPKANANKTNTSKKVNTNNKPKANATNKPKTTSNKPKNTNNKPKAPKKQTQPKKIEAVEEVKVEETDVVIAPVEVVEPEVVSNPIEEETVEENYEPTLEDTQKIENVIKQEIDVEAEQEQDLVKKKQSTIKCEKRIDLGIGIVLLGLIILIVTTYLSSTTNTNKGVIDGLVIGSLVVELIGIVIIVYNTIKSNK